VGMQGISVNVASLRAGTLSDHGHPAVHCRYPYPYAARYPMPAYPGEAKLGDRGRIVRVWQAILTEADVISDIPANHDGYYGPQMTNAVLSLQRSWGWKNADGVAGRAKYDQIAG
jgi:hypothetical protein